MARTVTEEHKQAMQQGRRASAAIDAYLKAIGQPKRRGRPVSVEELTARRDAALADAAAAEGVAKLKLVQAAQDLAARIEQASDVEAVDMAALEAGFVEHASGYSTSQGISYATWREVGVAADVLKRAGIRQTRRR